MKQKFVVETLQDTQAAGLEIAKSIEFPACIYLNGEMGTGKTTLSKAILMGLGYQGAVTSPTYNLIQEYSVDHGLVYHMDLYRVEDAEELEFLALPDLWARNTLFLVEWPQNGQGFLPPANYQIGLSIISDKGASKREIIFEKNA